MAKDGVKRQAATQTSKANSSPRLGQKKASPYKRYQMSQKTQYAGYSDGYNVGRTRRMA